MIGGAVSGIVQSRVVSWAKYSPLNLTSLPAIEASKSRRISWTASHIRFERSPASGQ